MTSRREDRLLGLDISITRRDFLNGALIGAGAMLMDLSSPLDLLAAGTEWDGDGGTGDYSRSNGNTHAVVSAAHNLRDGRYAARLKDARDTGETFDLVVIGGGISGLAAAHYFLKTSRSGARCLILENHPFPGGTSKRNEFLVEGQRLIGPQAANSFVVIPPGSPRYDIYSELGLPDSFSYQKISGTAKGLTFDTTNYGYMLWQDEGPGIGYMFKDPATGKSALISGVWEKQLNNTHLPEKDRQDLIRWRTSEKRYYEGRDFEAWLDTMTYRNYLEKVMGLGKGVSAFVDPVLACSIGLGSDAISALGAYQVAMPGFQGFPGGYSRRARESDVQWQSFPGGNDGFTRHFMKRLVPDSIRGADRFEQIMNGPVDFGSLDRSSNRVCIRLNSLAVEVRHDGDPARASQLLISYVKDGSVFRLRALSAVMASGSWVAKKTVKDLPDDYREAYSHFHRSPILVANVAVTNWRFLRKLGLTACRWFEGFGFFCNVRRQMTIGDYHPPLDPEKPTVLTLYVPFYYPGLPVREQGIKGRTELLATGYAEYERRIRRQLLDLFGSAGFDPGRDIAGIILNRWGHAFVNPQPGFYFGRDNKPAPRTVIRRRFGRIAFAHAELNGHQHWLGAAEEGQRAAKQVLGVL